MTSRTRRRLPGVLLAVVTLTPWQPAHAQGIPVIDVANLTQIIQIVEQVTEMLTRVKEEHNTIVRLGKGLGPLDRYRMPAIATYNHDVARFPFGASWLQGLDAGDARGDRYFSVVQPLSREVALLNGLTPEAKQALSAAYATIEILDSVAMMGGHQSAIVRTYHRQLQTHIDQLEADVVNPRTEFHELTAVADKISVGQVLARRQDMAGNQLLSNVLEQLIAKSKRTRDSEANTMNARINMLRDRGDTSHALVAGADAALTTWRQP
jgi:hypothetical protein